MKKFRVTLVYELEAEDGEHAISIVTYPPIAPVEEQAEEI